METASPATEMLGRLIAFDTVSRNSNLDLIAYAQELLEKAGATSRLTYDADKRKANLFATIGPARDGGYVLSGHSDVVPVEGQDWSSDPFKADVRDSRLYGRGSADMKGFIAVALSLAPEFGRLELKRPLHFAFSFDEEVGCLGVRRLLEDLKTANIRPALAIIGEPTEMRIVAAHKSGSVIETMVRGREGHSSAPLRGASAVMILIGLSRIGQPTQKLLRDLKRPPEGANLLRISMMRRWTSYSTVLRRTNLQQSSRKRSTAY